MYAIHVHCVHRIYTPGPALLVKHHALQHLWVCTLFQPQCPSIFQLILRFIFNAVSTMFIPACTRVRAENSVWRLHRILIGYFDPAKAVINQENTPFSWCIGKVYSLDEEWDRLICMYLPHHSRIHMEIESSKRNLIIITHHLHYISKHHHIYESLSIGTLPSDRVSIHPASTNKTDLDIAFKSNKYHYGILESRCYCFVI